MKTKNILIICVTLILFGIFFWPTLYHYDKMTVGGNMFPVRTNRLTGNSDIFLMNEWTSQKTKKGKMLPASELNKITGNAGLNGYGSFSGKIYNGSDWTITKMIIQVVAKEKEGTVRWNRKYTETTSIAPLTTGYISFDVTGDENVSSSEWSIDEVYGYKE
ncbi:hypothetical protein BAC1_01322 [uncultured bacterium]|nr:hypothetical protein BAC1_01322 [uncultured bacterium]